MMIQKSTGGPQPIQFVNYTIYHGGKESINNNTGNLIVVMSGGAHVQELYSFTQSEECFFIKLTAYLDLTTIYTGNNAQIKAVDWLSGSNTHQ